MFNECNYATFKLYFLYCIIAFSDAIIALISNVKGEFFFFECRDVVTGVRYCPINSNKHTSQLKVCTCLNAKKNVVGNDCRFQHTKKRHNMVFEIWVETVSNL
jgi:hypothetical protein